jgi:hypothetical protein
MQGNFSQLPQLIFDPASTSGSGASAARTPFPGNIIPTSRFSKVSPNIIPFIAAPNLPGLTNNHSYVNMTQITDRIWSLKVITLSTIKIASRISTLLTITRPTLSATSLGRSAPGSENRVNARRVSG